MIDYGRVIPVWIGARVQELNPILAQSLDLERAQGVIISEVEDDSPAEKAGLKVRDVIIEVDHQKIRTLNDWEDLAYLARASQTLDLVFLRDGKRINARLVPETLPGQPSEGSESRLGLTVANISSALAYRLGTNDRRGVVVAGVEKGSPAYEVGLEVGDIIRQINDQRIGNVENYEKLIKRIGSRDRLILLIERERGLYFVSLEQ